MTALLLLLACAIPAAREPATGGWPHPSGYGEAVHGADAVASGTSCLGCHAVEVGGTVQGATPAAPACQSCHAAWPHPAGYGTTDGHGAAWTADRAACTGCHGPTGEAVPAGRAEGSCVGCHASYPHPESYAAHVVHGADVLARGGPEACAGCHGAAGDEGPEAARCGSCHAAYPHPAGYADGAAHGAAWTAGGPEACGEGCHATGAAAPRVACTSCHDLYPHPADWSRSHVVAVQTRGEGACTSCHAAGTPAGGGMPVSCGASCHAAEAR